MMRWHWQQLDHMQIIFIGSRQITMPAPHHSFFNTLEALPDAQPTASKQRRQDITVYKQAKFTEQIV